jgi:hypothetical protein
MGRRDYPDAERIATRARKKRDNAGSQATLDKTSTDQYTQAHIIKAQNKDDKAVGSGIIGGMIDRRVNIMGARPFGRVRAHGGIEAEKHASGKLEPWVNTAAWLAQGDFDVWDTGVQRQQTIGETAGVVLPAPHFHGGKEYQELKDEWNRRIDEGESTKEVLEKMRVYRRDHFPIAWRDVNMASCYDDWDDEGRSEVYYFREMSRGAIEERYPGVGLEKNREKFEVIEYANDVYVATITPEGTGFLGTGIGRGKGALLGEPLKHEMGINPFYFIKRGPLLENTQGYTRTGCAFHAREMSQSLDEAMTFVGSGMEREGKAPLVTTLVPAIRTLLGIEDKKVEPDKKGNYTLYSSKEEGTEKLDRAPAPTVNEQYPYYIGLLISHIDKSGANIPQMLGYGPSGESAVHQNAARQSAITGELEVPHRRLEEGFAAVCERLLRCVIALDKMLPEDADEDMRKVVVRAPDKKHGSKEIAVTAKDVRTYELDFSGKITKNLPVNMGANVTNFMQLTDPQNAKIDDNKGREMFLNDENPQETEEKLFQQRLRRAYEDAYVQSATQRATLIVDEFSDEKIAKIAEKMMQAPVALQQAVLGQMGAEDGSRLMESMARGAANIGQAGRGQRESQLQGMNTEEAVV